MRILFFFAKSTKEEGGQGVQKIGVKLHYLRRDAFVDDPLFHFSKSFYRLNRYVHIGLKNLTYWLNVNRISLNAKKIELEIFKHQQKKSDSPIKIKVNRKEPF